MKWFDLILIFIVFGIFTVGVNQYFHCPLHLNLLMFVMLGLGVSFYDAYLKSKKGDKQNE